MKEIVRSSRMGLLVVKPITKEKAKELILKNHYSHTWNAQFGVYSFGVFKDGEEEEVACLGVAVYGYMKMPKAWLIELNRMWIDDCLGKNAESILISRSIKLLKKMDSNIVAVQSFADGRLGCGTIYKASNFQYYGKHQTIFLENKRTGEITHQQNLTNSTNRNRYIRDNVAYLMGDFRTFKVHTYRYIYPLCKHFQFKTPPQPYPVYDKGEIVFEWRRDRQVIKDRLKRLIDEL